MSKLDKHHSRGSVIVSVHSDDELYLYSAFIYNYKYAIIMHVPYIGDMGKINNQVNMFNESIARINEYRKSMGYEEIICKNTGMIGTSSRPLGLHEYEFSEVVTSIEDSMDDIDHIDYFLRPNICTHQNHCQAHTISNAVLRFPYINKISTVLTSMYPTDLAVGNMVNNYTYIKMDKSQVDHSIEIFKDIYNTKIEGRPGLDTSTYETTLKFYGCMSGSPYAQAYQLDRLVYDNNTLNGVNYVS